MDRKLPPWQSFVEHAELSDVGLRRSNNQDSFGQVTASTEDQWRRRGHLFMVADGMGAHAAGELASKMAVDTVTLTYYKLPDASPAEALRKSIEDANNKIHGRGQANPDFKGMGTTTSALLLLPAGAVVAHVGDSRVYRLRGNRLEQLSFDHSLVWEMMAGNKLSESEVPGYIPKNIITRSLGPAEQVQVDLEGPFPLAEGDTFLLCSDGLSGPVGDEDIGVVMGSLPPAEAVRTLVDLANLRGGPDNVTVLIAHVDAMPGGSTHVASSSSGGGRTVNPIWWIVFGVLALATVMLGLMGQLYPAIGTGVAALVAGMAIFLSRFSGDSSPGSKPMSHNSRLGRGPHRSYICELNLPAAKRMAGIIDSLKQEARQHSWKLDWTRFDGLCREAEASIAKQDFPAAIRSYCRAISFMMQGLRAQRGGKQDDEDDTDFETG